MARWAVDNPVLAQLLYWRPVPGFAPAAATFALSQAQMDELRAGLAHTSASNSHSSQLSVSAINPSMLAATRY